MLELSSGFNNSPLHYKLRISHLYRKHKTVPYQDNFPKPYHCHLNSNPCHSNSLKGIFLTTNIESIIVIVQFSEAPCSVTVFIWTLHKGRILFCIHNTEKEEIVRYLCNLSFLDIPFVFKRELTWPSRVKRISCSHAGISIIVIWFVIYIVKCFI